WLSCSERVGVRLVFNVLITVKDSDRGGNRQGDGDGGGRALGSRCSDAYVAGIGVGRQTVGAGRNLQRLRCAAAERRDTQPGRIGRSRIAERAATGVAEVDRGRCGVGAALRGGEADGGGGEREDWLGVGTRGSTVRREWAVCGA